MAALLAIRISRSHNAIFLNWRMLMTAADVLIETLMDWGVEIVFGLPGDGINGIMESLRTHQEKIRFVQVRHEKPPHSWPAAMLN